MRRLDGSFFFFFNDTATTEIYTLSLHDALPISLRQQAVQVNTTEAEFQEAAGKRRELRKKLEESRERRAEVGAMLERFSLLDKHYASDIERLRAIEEGGTLFNEIGRAHV